MNKPLRIASTEPFKGKGDVQILADMRRMQREKGIRKDKKPTIRETLERQIERINAGYDGRDEVAELAARARIEKASIAGAQERASQMWKESHAPARQGGKNQLEFDGPRGKKWSEALKKLRSFGPDAMVALVGEHGTGKTQLAVEMIRETCDRGQSALFTTATRFLALLRDSYREKSERTELGVLAEFLKPHLLVIDEAHRRRGSDWENAMLFELINDRYNARKPVILIANQTPDQFAASFGVDDGAVIQRMNETGGVIHCDWPSFRDSDFSK